MRSPSWRYLIRLAVPALIVSAQLVGAAMAADENSRVTLQVMTEETKRPVPSAHVVVRFISGKTLMIKNRQTTWEAQTNRHGDLLLEDIPKGHVKVQIIAKGYQTFGGEFEVTKTEENWTILMKPPAKQVSAY